MNYICIFWFSFYENLSGSNSDRFQYVFPYYDFSKNIETDLNGSFNFSSSGNKIENEEFYKFDDVQISQESFVTPSAAVADSEEVHKTS